MIKQGLNIKLGQSLSMTPQLQQAIKLLQLSSTELEQEIQEVLDTNPLLERSDDAQPIEEKPTSNTELEGKDANEEHIPEDMKIDADWDDIYDPEWKTTNSDSSNANSTSDFIETMHSTEQGLTEHLMWQVEMGNLSFQDKEIAKLIIDYLDDDGYLTEPLEQIHETLEDILLVELDEVEAVLTYVQHLSPTGIAAQSLGECLVLQLQHDYADHALFKKAKRLLEKHLDLLEKRDYTGIKRSLRVTDTVLENLIHLIRKLDPKPGKLYNNSSTDYIVPDVYVKNINGKWKISLNGSTKTELKVNSYYEDMLKEPTQKTAASQETNKYIKDNLQQAKWFINSLENRNSTILNVAHAIIENQLPFLQYGEEAMKPMVLSDLADQLGIHESTVSRVTTRKYMHTPRGVYEFKFFFSSHVSTDAGGECSATAIRAMIKSLIAKENPKKPLSDNKLTNLLNEQGINVARRTVAKYREAQSIPSSHDRKAFA
ncbi:RNA polymerase factor sigma-54 [Cocleimonas flava]|uniref:RNA polymerase sigma-54 factor n=1 Tax=Cocleimonas flava TaxID=634765 RepID=A0A4R1F2Y7_9GAMM|nr:RNA polymerase factor sigma-54 [Cocleimonas flava]TCJ86759.1 RNA polymerase RpoN-/SigL-like sigma 54 subunit [Cocleimonas flava]